MWLECWDITCFLDDLTTFPCISLLPYYMSVDCFGWNEYILMGSTELGIGVVPSHSQSKIMAMEMLAIVDIFLIQFPPEMDENGVRYGLAKLGQISRLPNWQRMLFCAYTTQLLHSTGEGCWNNKDSYFIWFEFVCRNSGQIASRRSWKRSCLGLEYTSKCSRLAPLWEPN